MQLAAIDPKVAPLNSGSQAAILQQDLLHPLPYLFVHPKVVWLIALAARANVPSVVAPGLHHSEQTHEVQKAQEAAKDPRQRQIAHRLPHTLVVSIRAINLVGLLTLDLPLVLAFTGKFQRAEQGLLAGVSACVLLAVGGIWFVAQNSAEAGFMGTRASALSKALL